MSGNLAPVCLGAGGDVARVVGKGGDCRMSGAACLGVNWAGGEVARVVGKGEVSGDLVPARCKLIGAV